MSHPILQLSSLSKTFPGQIALNQVDLEVRSGSIHALLGHNGSGKSTLIKLLSGFEKPAWDYQALIPQPVVGQGYSLTSRTVFKPFGEQGLDEAAAMCRDWLGT